MAKDLTMRQLSLSASFASSVSDGQAPDESGHIEDGRSSSAANTSQQTKHLGAMMLASKFAASTRMGAQKIKGIDMPKLRKPDEPDFSAETYD